MQRHLIVAGEGDEGSTERQVQVVREGGRERVQETPAVPPQRRTEGAQAGANRADVLVEAAQFQVQGAEVAGGTPAEFQALIQREVKAWADVVTAVGFKPQAP